MSYRRSTGGISASLTSVKYECSCGAAKSIAGAFAPDALQKLVQVQRFKTLAWN